MDGRPRRDRARRGNGVTNAAGADALPKRVLWVDAEADFLRAHFRFFAGNGFEVESVTSLARAQELLRDCPYAAVVVDEQTLGKEGTSTVQRVRSTCGARVPLLWVTKGDEERAANSERAREVDGFIGKPVNPVQALNAVRAAILARLDRTDAATSAYVRDRQELRSSLLATPSPANWEKIHFQMSKWDISVDGTHVPGLRETHLAHRRELNKAFLGFVEEQYSGWVGKKGGNPDLHTRTVRRKLLPALQRGKAALFVLSGLRFDQWLVVMERLKSVFKVENAAAWAVLPTEPEFCRVALYAGELARDVALDQPSLWARLSGRRDPDGESAEGGEDAGPDTAACLRELLRVHLRRLGAPVDDPRVLHVRDRKAAQGLASTLQEHADATLVAVQVDLLEMIRPVRADACLPLEPGASETDVRAAVAAAFDDCGLSAALAALAAQGRTVVLTAEHGSVRAETPAEVFCQEIQSEHPRVKVGANISCDERQALFIEAPERFGLPGEEGDVAYAIAKDRFYFAYPNKYQYFVTPFRGQMVSGGISPEEVIVPLATLTPLK